MSEGVSIEATSAVGDEVRALSVRVKDLQSELEKVRNDLDAERSKGFWSRVFRRPATDHGIEGTRERIRGKIAMSLIITLIVVVLATLVYLTWLSFGLAEVGTTLLTPLVGLIGAVTGFYYGGQQALQAASEASEAAQKTQETAHDTQKGVAQVATQAATQAAIKAAITPAATEAPSQTTQESTKVATQAATEVATEAATRAATEAAARAATEAVKRTVAAGQPEVPQDAETQPEGPQDAEREAAEQRGDGETNVGEESTER
jgi:cytoskeletal protein RodZ